MVERSTYKHRKVTQDRKEFQRVEFQRAFFCTIK